MKKVMIFFLLMLVSSSAYSQLQQVALLDPDKIYVNGLEMYRFSYSHQEVIDALGTPDKYYLNDEGYYCYYWYDEEGKIIANFEFDATDDRYFAFFGFKIPEFSINNLFTVGDHISKIPSSWKKELRRKWDDGSRIYYCSPANWVNTYERQSPLKVYCDERGFITKLAMHTGF